MKIVAVIPAYNCEKTIGKIVWGLKHNMVKEVLVVDDGSIDGTRLIAEKEGAIVISHPENRGLGCALRTGFIESLYRHYDIIVTLDADGQHSPDDIDKVTKRLIKNHCDAVIGSRLLKKEGWSKFPRHRLWGNRILTFFTNLACGKKMTTDSQSGYRALSRKVVESLDLRCQKMNIASEIIVELSRQNFRTVDVPIKPTYEQEISNQRIVRDSLEICWMLFRKSLMIRFEKCLHSEKIGKNILKRVAEEQKIIK